MGRGGLLSDRCELRLRRRCRWIALDEELERAFCIRPSLTIDHKLIVGDRVTQRGFSKLRAVYLIILVVVVRDAQLNGTMGRC